MKAGIRVMVGISFWSKGLLSRVISGQQGQFFLLYLGEHEFAHGANGLLQGLLAG